MMDKQKYLNRLFELQASVDAFREYITFKYENTARRMKSARRLVDREVAERTHRLKMEKLSGVESKEIVQEEILSTERHSRGGNDQRKEAKIDISKNNTSFSRRIRSKETYREKHKSPRVESKNRGSEDRRVVHLPQNILHTIFKYAKTNDSGINSIVSTSRGIGKNIHVEKKNIKMRRGKELLRRKSHLASQDNGPLGNTMDEMHVQGVFSTSILPSKSPYRSYSVNKEDVSSDNRYLLTTDMFKEHIKLKKKEDDRGRFNSCRLKYDVHRQQTCPQGFNLSMRKTIEKLYN